MSYEYLMGLIYGLMAVQLLIFGIAKDGCASIWMHQLQIIHSFPWISSVVNLILHGILGFEVLEFTLAADTKLYSALTNLSRSSA